jgi:UPF0176 protein
MESQSHQFKAAAFYKFIKLAEVERLKLEITQIAKDCSIRGLIVLAEEGINATVAGLTADVDNFLARLKSFSWAQDLEAKFSPSHFQPFKRFKVDLRPEIVTSSNLSLVVDGKNNHLTPQQWHEWINSDNPPTLLDTRNDYESRVGTFKNAITPPIKQFNEFAKYLEESGLPKEEPLLIFCTGGIRCEKAILEAKRLGYEKTYQLEGGILKYFEEYPQGSFEGECFIFDNRVSLNSSLKPSRKFKLCPHCGEPGDIKFQCGHCEEAAVSCHICRPKNACSKNCAYHLGVFKKFVPNKQNQEQSPKT